MISIGQGHGAESGLNGEPGCEPYGARGRDPARARAPARNLDARVNDTALVIVIVIVVVILRVRVRVHLHETTTPE